MLTRVMEENLGGIRVVRAFAAQAHELAKFDRASQERARPRAPPRRHPRRATPARCHFSFFAAMGLVLWVGGDKVIAGRDHASAR